MRYLILTAGVFFIIALYLMLRLSIFFNSVNFTHTIHEAGVNGYLPDILSPCEKPIMAVAWIMQERKSEREFSWRFWLRWIQPCRYGLHWYIAECGWHRAGRRGNRQHPVRLKKTKGRVCRDRLPVAWLVLSRDICMTRQISDIGYAFFSTSENRYYRLFFFREKAAAFL